MPVVLTPYMLLLVWMNFLNFATSMLKLLA